MKTIVNFVEAGSFVWLVVIGWMLIHDTAIGAGAGLGPLAPITMVAFLIAAHRGLRMMGALK